MILIIEASASNLGYIFIVLFLVLVGFTSAEFVAYGYKSEGSKTWLWALVNRLLGIFSGDPVLTEHTKQDRVLGMGLNIVFVIIFSMLLLNLIVALLTAGYEKAVEETSDVMARRQYNKLYAGGFVGPMPPGSGDVDKADRQLARIRRNRLLYAKPSLGSFSISSASEVEDASKLSDVAVDPSVWGRSKAWWDSWNVDDAWIPVLDCVDRLQAALLSPKASGRRWELFRLACCCKESRQSGSKDPSKPRSDSNVSRRSEGDFETDTLGQIQPSSGDIELNVHVQRLSPVGEA